jgi:hypothetical protein
LTGVGDVGDVSSHDGGYFVTDVFATFEMGGRLGAGLIQSRELGAPAPWHRAVLGLPPEPREHRSGRST